MTKAVSSKGVMLSVTGTIGGTAGNYWFHEVKSTPEIGESPQKIDVTHLTSDTKEYIKDIPDYSGELSFVMNAQPEISSPTSIDDSNLHLVRLLSKSSSYTWTVYYPSVGVKATLTADWTWKMSAASPSAAIELTVTLIPRSAPIWQPITASNTVTYNSNGGIGTMIDPSSPYTLGSTVTVMSCGFTPPTDQYFNGWNTVQGGSGTTYMPGDVFTITGNVTLYAQWGL